MKTGKKKIGKIRNIARYVFLGIVLLIILATAGNIVLYRSTDIKSTSQGENIHYEDKQFGYSFNYPNTWKKKTYLLGKGNVEIISDKDAGTNLSFWYKDSGKISDIDKLLAFVKDDAKYGEEKQGAKTESIEKETVNGKTVVTWSAQFPGEVHSKIYYFADFQPYSDQLIYIWTVTVSNKRQINPTDKAIIDSVLSSFTTL